MEDYDKTISEDGKTIVYTRGGQFVAKCIKTAMEEQWYNADDKRHRIDGPARIYYKNYQKTGEFWYHNGKYHRDDGPAVIYYYNDQKTCEFWYRNGKLHRDDGSAVIYYYNDQKTSEYWYRDGKQHRDDGPAMICYDNDQKTEEIWYRDGKYHRIDGPAKIYYKNGHIIKECWYRDGEFGGNVLAYIWLADINMRSNIYVLDRKDGTLDEFRNAVKSPLALELMRPLPIPIREAIYEHYCLQ